MIGKLALGGAVLALVTAACSGPGPRDGGGGLTSATTVREAGPDAAAWPTAGRDLANSRAVPRARLASDTIGQAYAQRTGELVSAHWILPGDADRMLAQAAAVTFEVWAGAGRRPRWPGPACPSAR